MLRDSAKFVKTLVLEFKKMQSNDKALYSTFANLKAEPIINDWDIDNVFKSIQTNIISNTKISRARFGLNC